MNGKDEMDEELRRAFDQLPGEATPPEFMEDSLVRALRAEGVLRGADRPAVHARRLEASGRRMRPWVLVPASMAASLVLVSIGVLIGQEMGARSAERIMLAVREQDHALVAQRVQEAGSAYVRALAALVEMRRSQTAADRVGSEASPVRVSSQIRQGGEAAFGALYAAALELARLAPGDPDVASILQILEDRRFADAEGSRATDAVWH